jgi:hypothetical protein
MFSFVNRATDVAEKFVVRVDVTEAFPFPGVEDDAVLRSLRWQTPVLSIAVTIDLELTF